MSKTIYGLHNRGRTRKGCHVWSAQCLLDGDIKWITVIVDEGTPEKEVRRNMESYLEAHDPRQRTA